MIQRLFSSRWRFRQLLAALALVILVMPTIAELTNIDTTAAALTIIVGGVVLASGHRNCWLTLGFAVPVLAMVWICTLSPDTDLRGYHYLAVSGLLFFSSYLSINYLRSHNEVDKESLAAAASVYLLFGLALGAVYAALEVWRPGGLGFSGLSGSPDFHDHVYFSFVVLTTIGFGDVLPQSHLTQSLVILEGIVGMFYIAMVISRLVGLYRSPPVDDDN